MFKIRRGLDIPIINIEDSNLPVIVRDYNSQRELISSWCHRGISRECYKYGKQLPKSGICYGLDSEMIYELSQKLDEIYIGGTN